MTAEIGELSVQQYLALAACASRGEKNALLDRLIALHGLRQSAIASARRFANVIEHFARRFGSERAICLYEAPGRVNLMGMHIDHRGGICNPVATRERICAVCSRRSDDLFCAHSLDREIPEGQFRLGERLPSSPLRSLGEWLSWSEIQAATRYGGKHFINYFACGPVYLACFHYAWGRSLAGADFVFDSDLPSSAGMSSSSALVVLATDFFLRSNPQGLPPLSSHQLLDVYGNGEWYIGTRGGKGDHAAIKLCQRGVVQPLVTTPDLRILQPAPIPQGYDLFLYASGDEANKSVEPFRTAFNTRVISYQTCEMMLTSALWQRSSAVLNELRAARATMDAKHHRIYLGDVVNYEIFSEAEIYRFLRGVPRIMTRAEIVARFPEHAAAIQAGMQHASEPEGGYHVRDVAAFGFGECVRARDAGPLLAAGDVRGFAAMMNVSQLGDRVSDVPDAVSRRVKLLDDAALTMMEQEGFPLREIAGDYRVSTQNIDRLVAICLSCPDVLGARLSGAGLGGAVIVLGREGFSETLDPILLRDYYEPLRKQFRKIRILPSQGAGFC
jgi:N-acetylgalactosamine kinase